MIFSNYSQCIHGLSISNTKAFNPSTICQSYGAGGAGKSILCEEDPYLLELVLYIHLNQMRAGIIKDLRASPISRESCRI